MAPVLPPSRLTDVLRRNGMETLKRHAAELASASSMLSAEGMQTRFLRNHLLINPKSLCVLVDDLMLERYHVFAVYKPPFCPMRRADAVENYHHVSVESFIDAALRSQAVFPVMARTLSPKEMQVRVLNDVDSFASGPVLVSVADKYPHARSLQGFTFAYDVLVAGHILQTAKGGGEGARPIPVEMLFPEVAEQSRGAQAAAATTGSPAAASASGCVCMYEVMQHAYYSVHPVSLVHVLITSPPSALPPSIESFVRDELHSCVLGDPVAMGDFIALADKKSSKTDKDAKWQQSAANETGGTGVRSHVVAMRGDCDFPRVFCHLRQVSFTVRASAASGTDPAGQTVTFHCNKCFDSLLHSARSFSLKAPRIGLLDGSWSPGVEFI